MICYKMGYRTDVPAAKLSTKGVSTSFWGSANLPAKVLRDMWYRSDIITISRDVWATKAPTSPLQNGKNKKKTKQSKRTQI